MPSAPAPPQTSRNGRLAIAGAAVLFGTSATATRLVDGMPDPLAIAAWPGLSKGLSTVCRARPTAAIMPSEPMAMTRSTSDSAMAGVPSLPLP